MAKKTKHFISIHKIEYSEDDWNDQVCFTLDSNLGEYDEDFIGNEYLIEVKSSEISKYIKQAYEQQVKQLANKMEELEKTINDLG